VCRSRPEPRSTPDSCRSSGVTAPGTTAAPTRWTAGLRAGPLGVGGDEIRRMAPGVGQQHAEDAASSTPEARAGCRSSGRGRTAGRWPPGRPAARAPAAQGQRDVAVAELLVHRVGGRQAHHDRQGPQQHGDIAELRPQRETHRRGGAGGDADRPAGAEPTPGGAATDTSTEPISGPQSDHGLRLWLVGPSTQEGTAELATRSGPRGRSPSGVRAAGHG
jgi:hypothetical protein